MSLMNMPNYIGKVMKASDLHKNHRQWGKVWKGRPHQLAAQWQMGSPKAHMKITLYKLRQLQSLLHLERISK